MAAEAPKTKALIPEVGKGLIKGGLIGAGLVLGYHLLLLLPSFIVGTAVLGGFIGLINWAANS